MMWNLRRIFGDTWEDFLSLPISESNRRLSEWAIHYVIQDGISYVVAAGRGDEANFLLYNEARIKVTDTIEINAVYQLDYQNRRITGWWIEDGSGPWEFKD